MAKYKIPKVIKQSDIPLGEKSAETCCVNADDDLQVKMAQDINAGCASAFVPEASNQGRKRKIENKNEIFEPEVSSEGKHAKYFDAAGPYTVSGHYNKRKPSKMYYDAAGPYVPLRNKQYFNSRRTFPEIEPTVEFPESVSTALPEWNIQHSKNQQVIVDQNTDTVTLRMREVVDKEFKLKLPPSEIDKYLEKMRNKT